MFAQSPLWCACRLRALSSIMSYRTSVNERLEVRGHYSRDQDLLFPYKRFILNHSHSQASQTVCRNIFFPLIRYPLSFFSHSFLSPVLLASTLIPFPSLSVCAVLCVSPRFCPYSVTRSTKKDYVLSNNWITSTSLCQRPGAMCVLTDFQVCRCCSPF